MIQLRILNGVSLEGPDGTDPRSVMTQPKRLGLLVWLALAPRPRAGRIAWRRRDTACALFWPEADTERARASLRQALSFIRRCLGDAVVVTQGDEEIGVDPAQLACDAVRLRAAAAARDWAAAERLLGGPPLDGFHVPQAAAELDEWLERERESLRAAAAEVYRALSEERAAAGDVEGAVRAARAAVAMAPDDEAAAARLIALLDRQGNRAGALASYEELRGRLAAAYDAEPSPETQALAQRIRSRGMAVPGGGRSELPTTVAGLPDQAGASAPGAKAPGRHRRDWRSLLRLGVGIAGVAAIAAGSRSLLGRSGRPAPAADPPAVAVAALTNATGDTAMTFLAAGIGEAIRGGLLGSGSVAVIHLRRPPGTAPKAEILSEAVARGADAVLEGELRRSGSEVVLDLRLTDAGTSRAFWSERYTLPLSRLIEVEEEITTTVLQRLRIAARDGATAGAGTSSVAAHMDYLRGWYASGERTPEAFVRARDLFLRAIAEDPTYAAAYVGLSGAYQGLAHYGALPARDAFPRAEAAARRALQIDSMLAGGYTGLAAVRSFYSWDWAGAERLYRRALQLDPGDPITHNFYGIQLRVQGRFDEAAEQMKLAGQLDPLARIYVRQLGLVYYCAGRFDAALAEFRRAAAMDPGYGEARLRIVETLARLGQYDEAIAAWREDAKTASSALRDGLAHARGEAGFRAADRVEAAEQLVAMEAEARNGYVSPGARARVYARLGRWGDALEWLERAADERDPNVLKIDCDREFAPIRADARYQAVRARTGLR